jgi:hypothetical protein
MRTFHSNKSNKYPYAYDEFGNIVSIEEAVKLDNRKWYLDPGLQIELNLLCNLPKQIDHWRTLSNQRIIINGIYYDYSHDKDSESFEHKQFKFNILEKQYINIKDYKVFLINPKEEIRIVDSKFRADVLANLPCGTPCVIEIIKTSDISQKKQDFIEQNQILTFKIYIDENGNQISKRDDIIGVTEISELNRRIQDGEGKIAEIRDNISRERGERENKLREQTDIYTRELRNTGAKLKAITDRIAELEADKGGAITDDEIEQSDTIRWVKSEIEQHERTIDAYNRKIQQPTSESEIELLENRISECNEKLRIETELQRSLNKSYIDIIKGYQEEINRLRDLESETLKIIENCNPEWFGHMPKGVSKIDQILYLIS